MSAFDPVADAIDEPGLPGSRPFEFTPPQQTSGFTVPPPVARPAPTRSIFTDPAEAQRLQTAIQPGDPSPDEAARLYRLQLKTGLPVDVIRQNLDQVTTDAARADFNPEQYRKTSPLLASWLASDRYHVALTQDDIAPLSTMDRALQIGSNLLGDVGTASAGMLEQLGSGLQWLGEQPVRDARAALTPAGRVAPGNIDLYRQPTVANADGSISTVDSVSIDVDGHEVLIPRVTPDGRHLTTDQAIAEYRSTGRNLGTFDSPATATAYAQQLHEDYAAGRYHQPGAVDANAALADAGRRLATWARAEAEKFALGQQGASFIERAIHSGVQSTVQNIPSILAGLVGGEGAGLAVMGLATGAQAYGQARTEGVPFARATAFAGGQGIVEVATEMLPMHLLLGDLHAKAPLVTLVMHQIASEVPGEVVATTLQDLNEWAVLPENKDKTFGDYLRARPSATAATVIATLTTLGLTSVVAHGTARVLQQLGTAAQESKTATRVPDKVAEFLDHAAAGSPLAVVHLPVDTFTEYYQSQGENPEEVATRLTGDATAYQTAREHGTELAVPIGKYVTEIGTDEAKSQFFSQEARVAPGEMNAREAAQFSKEAADAALTEPGAPAAASPSPAQQVHALVVAQLTAGGKMPQATAETIATLYQHTFGTLAARAGVDPVALYQQYGLQVTREGLPATTPAAAASVAPVFDATAPRENNGATTPTLPLEPGLQTTPPAAALQTGAPGATLAANGDRQSSGGSAAAVAGLDVRGRDAESVAAAPLGPADGSGDGARAAEGRTVEIPGRYAEHFDTLLADARAEGFTGSADQLATLYLDEVRKATEITRELNADTGEPSAEDLLAAIARMGGIGINEESSMQGELETMLEGFGPERRREVVIKRGKRAGQTMRLPEKFADRIGWNKKRPGSFKGIGEVIVREGGRPLDTIREQINQAGEGWDGKFDNLSDFVAAVDEAIRIVNGTMEAPGSQAYDVLGTLEGALGVKAGSMWWADTSFDITEFDQAARPTMSTASLQAWAADIAKRTPGLEQVALHLGSNGDINVEAVTVDTGADAQAVRSQALLELTDLADLQGRRIVVSLPQADRAALRTLYADFGFVDHEGPTMVREPAGGATLHQERRGFLRFGPNRQINIGLLSTADLSTFLHESGHFFLEVLGDLADHVNAIDAAARTPQQAQLAADYTALLTSLGVTSRAAISTAQHEQFARTFEAYLMEGKAPSVELRSTFARFRAWLLGVYRSLTALNVTLQPEVRRVLDRMVASDHAIAVAEQEGHVAPLFMTPAGMGKTPAEFALYAQGVQKAADAARATLEARVLAEVQREQTATWAAARETTAAAVTSEIHAQPVYRAIAAMQKGTQPDGSPLHEGMTPEPLKLSRAILVEQYGGDRLKALPKPYVYTKEGGLDPAVVADLFGFSSGDELLNAVAAATPMRQAIAQETDRRMIAEHGSLLLDGTLHAEAQAAIANGEHDEVIKAELRALAELERKARPALRVGAEALAAAEKERAYERRWLEAEARLRIAIAEGHKQVEIDALTKEIRDLKAQARGGAATIRAVLPRDADLKERARAVMAAMRVEHIAPSTYWTAARRASMAATSAAAKQDFGAAITAKQQELLNLALFRAATAAKDDVGVRARRAKALEAPAAQRRLGKAELGLLGQVNAVLDRFSFARLPAKDVEARLQLRDWVAQREADGLPIDLPAEVLSDLRLPYTQLTYEQLVGVSDGLDQLVYIARLKNRLLKAIDERDFATVRDLLVASIGAHNVARPVPLEFTARDERTRTVAGWFASHMKMAILARALDGHEDGGAFWEHFIRQLNAAADAEVIRKQEEGKAYAAILNAHYTAREIGAFGQKLAIPAIGGSLSKEARLAVALNQGNQQNRDRLLSDPRRQWKARDVAAILDTLDARDWQFVQATWDYLEHFWPEIAAKEKRLTGLAPEKVAPAPVTTKFGELRGGYYPIVYDGRLTLRAGAQQAATEAKLVTSAAYVQTTTRRGHTKARNENVNLSVKLDLGGIFSHVEQVVHDLTHHETLIDLTRLLRDPAVSTAILDAKGDQVYQQFVHGLQDVAIGTAPATNALEKSANFMRKGTQIAALGWNLWTALQQPLGLFNGASRVGPTWVARGMKRWMRDAVSMQSTTTWIAEVSPFMRSRVLTATEDLANLRGSLRQPGGWFDTAVRTVSADHVTQQGILDSFLWHIGIAQRVADAPTWLGQYEKSMAAGEPEARAFALADQAVIDAQGSGSIKDLAAIQRGGPLAKLWMTFYSYGNTVFNASADAVGKTSFKSPASVATLLGHLSLLYIFPSFATVALKDLVKGGDDKDLEDFLQSLSGDVLASALNGMVGIREIGGLLQPGGVHGYAGPAGARALQLAYQLGGQIEQGKVDEGLLKAVNAAAGVLFRYPALQVERTVDGAAALLEGRTENPTALLFGAPPKKASGQ